MHRILQVLGRQVLDLGEAELLALVDVQRPRQGGDEQRRGASAAQAEGEVGRRADALGGERERRVGAAVAGHHSGDVVVGQHPRRRCPDRGVAVQRVVDARTKRCGVPRAGEEVEVERPVQLVGSEVAGEALAVLEPHLADQRAGRIVGIGDRSPRAVDVVDLVAVDERVLDAARRVLDEVGQGWVLDRQRSRVDADSRRATVEPEAQDRLVLLAHRRVVPVEVGLARGEEVEEPIAACPVGVLRPRPRRVAEVRGPVVGRLIAARASSAAEPEAVTHRRCRAAGVRLDEPRMLVGHVVGDDVDDRADAEGEGLGDQCLGFGQRSERRVDGAVVGDVVTAVEERRGVPRVVPDGVDAEVAEVAEASAHAGKVADPVAVGVGEAAHVELIDDGVAPPGALWFRHDLTTPSSSVVQCCGCNLSKPNGMMQEVAELSQKCN